MYRLCQCLTCMESRQPYFFFFHFSSNINFKHPVHSYCCYCKYFLLAFNDMPCISLLSAYCIIIVWFYYEYNTAPDVHVGVGSVKTKKRRQLNESNISITHRLMEWGIHKINRQCQALKLLLTMLLSFKRV